MIGCFNMNGHDCNQSDLDTVLFVPHDVLEDAEVRQEIGHEALIYDPFNVLGEDEMDFGDASNDNELGDFGEIFDPYLEETFWSSLMLGSDYDWDDEPNEDVIAWVHERYADVIRLNDEIGYQSRSAEVIPFTAILVGRKRENIRRPHWSDKRVWRESINYDHLRGKAHRK